MREATLHTKCLFAIWYCRIAEQQALAVDHRYMQDPPFSHGGHPSTIEPYIDLLASGERQEPTEVRIRWDGVFESKEQAHVLTDAVGGLALGGPAGIGSGLGPQPSLAVEIISIGKELVPREDVKWALWEFCEADGGAQVAPHAQGTSATQGEWNTTQDDGTVRTLNGVAVPDFDHASFAGAAPAPEKMAMVPEPAQPVPSEACTVQLYDIAHGRSGDKVCRAGSLRARLSGWRMLVAALTRHSCLRIAGKHC